MRAGALTERPQTWNLNLMKVQEVEVKVPQPTWQQVLIKVAGSSVNPIDWKLAETPEADFWDYPHIFGRDCAGTVVAVGPGTSRLKVGDRVWADNAHAEGCIAEYVVLPESITGLAPTKLTLAEAAVLPLVALTGLEGFTYAKAPWTAPGLTVLVLGGSGGTGHIGIQLAKALGAHKVITTCGTPNINFCKEMGADQVIDYHDADWHAVLPHRSVDVIYDTVALTGTGEKAFDTLQDNGYFVTLLPQALAPPRIAMQRPSVKQHNFMLDAIGYKQLDALKSMVDEGKLRPHVQSTFSIPHLAEAFKTSMAGHIVGKVSVTPERTSQQDSRSNTSSVLGATRVFV